MGGKRPDVPHIHIFLVENQGVNGRDSAAMTIECFALSETCGNCF
jgi:hypothetical protein